MKFLFLGTTLLMSAMADNNVLPNTADSSMESPDGSTLPGHGGCPTSGFAKTLFFKDSVDGTTGHHTLTESGYLNLDDDNLQIRCKADGIKLTNTAVKCVNAGDENTDDYQIQFVNDDAVVDDSVCEVSKVSCGTGVDPSKYVSTDIQGEKDMCFSSICDEDQSDTCIVSFVKNDLAWSSDFESTVNKYFRHQPEWNRYDQNWGSLEKGTEYFECPEGSQPMENGGCSPCEPGQYFHRTDGICKNCEAGTFLDGPADECELCPVGTFAANAGMDACEKCPIDKYQDDLGQSSCDDILAGDECAENTFGAVADEGCSDTSKVSEGLYRVANSGTNLGSAIPLGKECGATDTETGCAVAPTDCDNGKYRDDAATTYCVDIDAGKQCANELNDAQNKGCTGVEFCPTGTFADGDADGLDEDANACDDIVAGKECSSSVNTRCLELQQEYDSVSSNQASTALEIKAAEAASLSCVAECNNVAGDGSELDLECRGLQDGGSGCNEVQICYIGLWSPGNQPQCDAIPLSQECGIIGTDEGCAVAPTDCAVGKYRSETDTSYCDDIPLAQESEDQGASGIAPTGCEVGYERHLSATNVCVEIAAGYESAGQGASGYAPTACLDGSFYGGDVKANECTTIDAGEYCTGFGLGFAEPTLACTTVGPTTQGHYSVGASNAQTEISLGQECGAAGTETGCAVAPTDCDNGKYRDDAATTYCVDIDAGKQCSSTAFEGCTGVEFCPTGTFAAGDADGLDEDANACDDIVEGEECATRAFVVDEQCGGSLKDACVGSESAESVECVEYNVKCLGAVGDGSEGCISTQRCQPGLLSTGQQNLCVDIDAGKKCVNALDGANGCYAQGECNMGFYSPGGQDACVECTSDYIDHGNSGHEPTQGGSYASSGADACTACGAGKSNYYQSTTGGGQCEDNTCSLWLTSPAQKNLLDKEHVIVSDPADWKSVCQATVPHYDNAVAQPLTSNTNVNADCCQTYWSPTFGGDAEDNHCAFKTLEDLFKFRYNVEHDISKVTLEGKTVEELIETPYRVGLHTVTFTKRYDDDASYFFSLWDGEEWKDFDASERTTVICFYKPGFSTVVPDCQEDCVIRSVEDGVCEDADVKVPIITEPESLKEYFDGSDDETPQSVHEIVRTEEFFFHNLLGAESRCTSEPDIRNNNNIFSWSDLRGQLDIDINYKLTVDHGHTSLYEGQNTRHDTKYTLEVNTEETTIEDLIWVSGNVNTQKQAITSASHEDVLDGGEVKFISGELGNIVSNHLGEIKGKCETSLQVTAPAGNLCGAGANNNPFNSGDSAHYKEVWSNADAGTGLDLLDDSSPVDCKASLSHECEFVDENDATVSTITWSDERSCDNAPIDENGNQKRCDMTSFTHVDRDDDLYTPKSWTFTTALLQGIQLHPKNSIGQHALGYTRDGQADLSDGEDTPTALDSVNWHCTDNAGKCLTVDPYTVLGQNENIVVTEDEDGNEQSTTETGEVQTLSSECGEDSAKLTGMDYSSNEVSCTFTNPTASGNIADKDIKKPPAGLPYTYVYGVVNYQKETNSDSEENVAAGRRLGQRAPASITGFTQIIEMPGHTIH